MILCNVLRLANSSYGDLAIFSKEFTEQILSSDKKNYELGYVEIDRPNMSLTLSSQTHSFSGSAPVAEDPSHLLANEIMKSQCTLPGLCPNKFCTISIHFPDPANSQLRTVLWLSLLTIINLVLVCVTFAIQRLTTQWLKEDENGKTCQVCLCPKKSNGKSRLS